MAPPAMAQDLLLSLRRQIARIEGTQPERLEGGGLREGRDLIVSSPGTGDAPEMAGVQAGAPETSEAGLLVRRHAPDSGRIRLGVAGLDMALGGGLPRAALTEIIGRQTRDAAAVAGFALALAALAGRDGQLPLLWIGLSHFFMEAGLPYATGFTRLFGIAPDRLLLVHPKRIEDALWAAEEAAVQNRFAAILLELHGNPARLDLTATRRLSLRARAAGYPLFLIRHGGKAQPTAATTRFEVGAAASSLRGTFSGPVSHSIGPPAFAVTLTRSRTGKEGTFVLEWNAHDLSFQERQPVRGRPLHAGEERAADAGGLAAASFDGPHLAPAPWHGLASGRKAG